MKERNGKWANDFDVTYKGHRYWAHAACSIINYGRDIGFEYKFWSDHDWPMYHGSFVGLPDDAKRAFDEWLPFRVDRTM